MDQIKSIKYNESLSSFIIKRINAEDYNDRHKLHIKLNKKIFLFSDNFDDFCEHEIDRFKKEKEKEKEIDEIEEIKLDEDDELDELDEDEYYDELELLGGNDDWKEKFNDLYRYFWSNKNKDKLVFIINYLYKILYENDIKQEKNKIISNINMNKGIGKGLVDKFFKLINHNYDDLIHCISSKYMIYNIQSESIEDDEDKIINFLTNQKINYNLIDNLNDILSSREYRQSPLDNANFGRININDINDSIKLKKKMINYIIKGKDFLILREKLINKIYDIDLNDNELILVPIEINKYMEDNSIKNFLNHLNNEKIYTDLSENVKIITKSKIDDILNDENMKSIKEFNYNLKKLNWNKEFINYEYSFETETDYESKILSQNIFNEIELNENIPFVRIMNIDNDSFKTIFYKYYTNNQDNQYYRPVLNYPSPNSTNIKDVEFSENDLYTNLLDYWLEEIDLLKHCLKKNDDKNCYIWGSKNTHFYLSTLGKNENNSLAKYMRWSKDLSNDKPIVVNYKVKINNCYYNENNDFYKSQSNDKFIKINQYVDFFIIISPGKNKNMVNIICQVTNTDLIENQVNINKLGDKIKNIINLDLKKELISVYSYEYAFLIKNNIESEEQEEKKRRRTFLNSLKTCLSEAKSDIYENIELDNINIVDKKSDGYLETNTTNEIKIYEIKTTINQQIEEKINKLCDICFLFIEPSQLKSPPDVTHVGPSILIIKVMNLKEKKKYELIENILNILILKLSEKYSTFLYQLNNINFKLSNNSQYNIDSYYYHDSGKKNSIFSGRSLIDLKLFNSEKYIINDGKINDRNFISNFIAFSRFQYTEHCRKSRSKSITSIGKFVTPFPLLMEDELKKELDSKKRQFTYNSKFNEYYFDENSESFCNNKFQVIDFKNNSNVLFPTRETKNYATVSYNFYKNKLWYICPNIYDCFNNRPLSYLDLTFNTYFDTRTDFDKDEKIKISFIPNIIKIIGKKIIKNYLIKAVKKNKEDQWESTFSIKNFNYLNYTNFELIEIIKKKAQKEQKNPELEFKLVNEQLNIQILNMEDKIKKDWIIEFLWNSCGLIGDNDTVEIKKIKDFDPVYIDEDKNIIRKLENNEVKNTRIINKFSKLKLLFINDSDTNSIIEIDKGSRYTYLSPPCCNNKISDEKNFELWKNSGEYGIKLKSNIKKKHIKLLEPILKKIVNNNGKMRVLLNKNNKLMDVLDTYIKQIRIEHKDPEAKNKIINDSKNYFLELALNKLTDKNKDAFSNSLYKFEIDGKSVFEQLFQGKIKIMFSKPLLSSFQNYLEYLISDVDKDFIYISDLIDQLRYEICIGDKNPPRILLLECIENNFDQKFNFKIRKPLNLSENNEFHILYKHKNYFGPNRDYFPINLETGNSNEESWKKYKIKENILKKNTIDKFISQNRFDINMLYKKLNSDGKKFNKKIKNRYKFYNLVIDKNNNKIIGIILSKSNKIFMMPFYPSNINYKTQLLIRKNKPNMLGIDKNVYIEYHNLLDKKNLKTILKMEEIKFAEIADYENFFKEIKEAFDNEIEYKFKYKNKSITNTGISVPINNSNYMNINQNIEFSNIIYSYKKNMYNFLVNNKNSNDEIETMQRKIEGLVLNEKKNYYEIRFENDNKKICVPLSSKGENTKNTFDDFEVDDIQKYIDLCFDIREKTKYRDENNKLIYLKCLPIRGILDEQLLDEEGNDGYKKQNTKYENYNFNKTYCCYTHLLLETGDKIKIKTPFHITEKEKKNKKYKISSLLSDTRIHSYFNRLLNSELDKSLNKDYYKQLYNLKILELLEYKIFLELQLECNEANKKKIINIINNQFYTSYDEKYEKIEIILYDILGGNWDKIIDINDDNNIIIYNISYKNKILIDTDKYNKLKSYILDKLITNTYYQYQILTEYKLKDELIANENETLFSEENKYDILDNYKSDIQIYHNNHAPINNINLDIYINHLSQFEQIKQEYIDIYNNLN